MIPVCKEKECGRAVHARGWCMAHYMRNRKGLAMDGPIRPHRPRVSRKGLCAGPRCDRRVTRGGYCQTHYLRSIQEPHRMSEPLPLRRGRVYQIGIPVDVAEAAGLERERRGIEGLAPILREWMEVGHAAWLEERRLEAQRDWEFGKQKRSGGGGAR